ncbi:prepilin-type N-terminal cleavage/methylation domain-containing protein [Psychrobacter sp. PAMC27889]|nr:prepilin-type N-terminal cleavage/methylation domain-containing protein [Psychrobacter sp. PAMC27889]
MTSSGFTLIELMVTIAVLAIIVSIAAPNISTQLANQRVKSTAAIFENALKEAKVESVIRRQNVTIIYNAAATPKTLTLRANNNDIARYNINNRSSVDQRITPAGVNSIIFRPDKTIANGATVIYTICDSGSNSETPRQVNLSRIGNVDTKNAGRC